MSVIKGEETRFPRLSCTGLGFYGNRMTSPWTRSREEEKGTRRREKVEGPWNAGLPVDEEEAARWEEFEEERVQLVRLRARRTKGGEMDGKGSIQSPEEDARVGDVHVQVGRKRDEEEEVRIDRSQEISTTSIVVQPSSLPFPHLHWSPKKTNVKQQTLLTSSFPKSKSFITTTNSPKVQVNSRSESTPNAYRTSTTITLSQHISSADLIIAEGKERISATLNQSTSTLLPATKKKPSASNPIIKPQKSSPREGTRSSPGPTGIVLQEEEQEETQKEDQVDFERPKVSARKLSLEDELLGEVGSSEFVSIRESRFFGDIVQIIELMVSLTLIRVGL